VQVIPEQEIERPKRAISLERLAVAQGIQLKKHGEIPSLGGATRRGRDNLKG